MSTNLDLSKLSLMDALDLATLIEEEARQRYEMFATQLGHSGSGYDPGSFFATMAENEAKHGAEIKARRTALFGETPVKIKLHDIYDIEAPEMGAPHRGMSTVQAFEIGLAAEKKACEFFDMALPNVTDPEVKALFTELRDEEAEHLVLLRKEMAKLPASASQEADYDTDDIPYM
jgi:rubrerythrin